MSASPVNWPTKLSSLFRESISKEKTSIGQKLGKLSPHITISVTILETYFKDVGTSQGLCNNFPRLQICWRRDEKTPEYKEKNGAFQPSLAIRDPQRFALLSSFGVFLAHTLTLLDFWCIFELMRGEWNIFITFQIFSAIIFKNGVCNL